MPKSNKGLMSTTSVKEHVHDYSSKTSIHGIKYVGEKNRPHAERLWWTLMLLLAGCGSGYNIYKIWFKWNASPVIVSFSEKSTPVWQVPFPAVTLCPQTKSKATLFNFSMAYGRDLPPDKKRMAGDVSLVCPRHIIVNHTEPYANQSTMDFIMKVAPSIEESFAYCEWKNEAVNCTDVFTTIMTDDGLCFTFNMLHPNELFRGQGVLPLPDVKASSSGWNLEDGYGAGASMDTYPYRTVDAGTTAGLFVDLVANEDDYDYVCQGPVPGFKVTLHNPAEIPRVSKRYFRVPMKQEVLVGVSPDIMTTNDALRGYDPHIRQCYFPSERYLAHFNVYTHHNCQLECTANFTAEKCNCIAIYMPRIPGLALCGAGKKHCIVESIDLLRERELEPSYRWEGGKMCDCLPACSSLEYDSTLSQAGYQWDRAIQKLKSTNNASKLLRGMTRARLAIFFKDKQFITSQRSELFGFSDFLASCGGVLGLFSGISLLSIIEIIYYATLRFWNNLKESKKQKEDNQGSDS